MIYRISLVAFFFGSSTIMQTVLPSTLTTVTVNKTITASERATRLFIDDPSTKGPLGFEWYTGGDQISALNIMPLVWAEGKDSVGVPLGFKDK